MDNVIRAVFVSDFYEALFIRIKFDGGPVAAELALIKEGHHPTFAKVAVKKVIKKRGW